jgi:hypothetical protein
MPYMTWATMLNSPSRKEAGAALATSTTLTDISPAPQLQLPAMFLQEGSTLTLKAWGVFSTTTGPPTLLLGFYYGGVAGVALGTTGAFTTTASITNVPWRIELDVDVWTDGATGTCKTQGYAWFGTSVSAWTTAPIPNTANTGTVTIDTTASKVLSVGAQWGTSSASNTVTCHGFKVFSDGV